MEKESIEIDLSVIEQMEDMILFGSNGSGKYCCNDKNPKKELAQN